jgi:hypothetical protein
VPDSNAKTLDSRGASPLRAAPLAEIVERFVSESVQTSANDVFFDPAIPRIRIEFREPFPECGEFIS